MKFIFRASLTLLAFFAMLLSSNAQFSSTVVAVRGVVLNELTGEPVKIKIQLLDETGKTVNRAYSNSKTGEYYMTGLRAGLTYKCRLVSDNFLMEEFTLHTPNTDKYLEISRDFMVKPLIEGKKIPLKVPPFELRKSKIKFGASIILEDITSALRLNDQVKFEIICYPDSQKQANENPQITEERASALRDYFVAVGISPDRISVTGAKQIDPDNPPPAHKEAKGKRYIGTTYVVIKEI